MNTQEHSCLGGLVDLHAFIIDSIPYYAHRDALGNVIALTSQLTSVMRTYYYDAWGTATGGYDAGFANRDRARWKGALWMGPETDLYYMRNRWYEPRTGRFLSEDPIGLAGGLNPYTFGGSDPVNFRDPLGEDMRWIAELDMYLDCRDFPHRDGQTMRTMCYNVEMGGMGVIGHAGGSPFGGPYGSPYGWLGRPGTIGGVGGGPGGGGAAQPRQLAPEGPSCANAVRAAAVTAILDIATLVPGIGALRAGVAIWKAGRNAARVARAGDYVLQAGWGYARAQSRREASRLAGAAGRSYVAGEPAQLGVGYASGIFPGSTIENIAAFIPGASTIVGGYAALKACGVL